jgi:DNA-binding beta-propeller fold protein YncE
MPSRSFPSSLSRLCAAGVATVVVVLAIGASTASAGKGVVDSFGQAGTGAGEFAFATGVAVNQATGDVYVADADCCSFSTGGQRVLQFTATGDFVRGWGWGVATGAEAFEVCTTSCLAGIQGSGDGQFSLGMDSGPPQIAVDQTDGSVYVADNLNDRIQKFSASGAFLDKFGTTGAGQGELSLPLGVAVDPVSSDVYVADTNNNRVQRFDSDGNFVDEFGNPGGTEGPLSGPSKVVVDSTGRVYVLDAFNGRVLRFTDTGDFDQTFADAIVAAPTNLAIDPANDHLYIAANAPDFSSQAIFELDVAGTLVDTHAANTGIFGFPAGIAVRSSTGVIYASSPFSPKAVMVIDDFTPPTVSIDPVTDITATTATFNGTINSQGPPNTNYRFEYSTDGTTWTPVPDSDVAIGTDTTDTPVTQTVTGLDPDTDYRIRLVATEDFNAAATTSPEETFTTDTAPPLVRPLGVGSRTDTVAWLGGEINPRNSQTNYYIEYTLDTDTDYANSSRVPSAPTTQDIGDGNDYVTVTELATGLQPDTTYRYRVVATNVAGTTHGPSRTFTTRNTLPTPPKGRAYEMVSPLDKNGAEIARGVSGGLYSTSGAALSGNAVAYAAVGGQFGGIESSPPQGQYLSVRSQTGWGTRGISPRIEQYPGGEANSASIWYLSEELSHAVVSSSALLAEGASLLNGSWGLYLQDNSGPASSYDLLSRPTSLLTSDRTPSSNLRFVFAAATPEMDHVVFDANSRRLTDEGVDNDTEVYEWVDGHVRLVSKLPSGEPALGALAGGRNQFGLFTAYPGDNVVSDDGGRIYFRDQADGLYVREHGTTTRLVSASERPGEDPSPPGEEPSIPRPGRFWAAEAATGSKAIFTSAEKLTQNAKAQFGREDLYLWSAEGPAGARLTDLTPQDDDGGSVLGVAAFDDDLSRIYFVARGDLAAGAAPGNPNLYMWSASGEVEHIAVLAEEDEAIWSRERQAAPGFHDVRLSADGDTLLFASRANVTATDTQGHAQLYRFDAGRDRLQCVSCGGQAVTGDAWMFFRPGNAITTLPYRMPQNLSADGERVFFETLEALVGRDVNGRADVYMWSDGEVSLISTGMGFGDSEFLGASASGDDVFFTTREQLVGSDTDELVDVYDARVGGGFPEQEVPEECVGDQCQGVTSGVPGGAGLGSRDLRGRGDVVSGVRGSFSLSRLSRAQRARLAAGRRVVLRLRVSGPGRVRVVARARIGGRGRIVASGSRAARKAGVVRVGLRLSSQARRRLSNGGGLAVRLSARFSGGGAPRALRLDLRRPR